jgi:hypothetical protein
LLIELIVVLVVLAVIGYAAWWVCHKFQLPPPVLWVVGAVLLIGLLIFASRFVQGGTPVFVR